MLNQKIRYGVVHDLVLEHRAGSILEVGSGSTGLGRYFRGVRFTGVDLEFTDYGAVRGRRAEGMTAVRADARRLPFRNGAFDLVLSLDMLEHLDPDDRPPVVRELARVSRDHVVVAFPCGTPAQTVERRLAEKLRAAKRPVPGWLVEHSAIDFPMPEEMDELFTSLGHPFRVAANESLFLYRLIRRAESIGRLGKVLDRVVSFGLLSRLDRKGTAAIRRAYIIEKRAPRHISA
ncbi:MAG: class I SAM-dependent methyltransferase [Planctomycetota bacterium]|jgi:SAM-dependent methyltransferase